MAAGISYLSIAFNSGYVNRKRVHFLKVAQVAQYIKREGLRKTAAFQ
jgi:hypothetical protein